MIRTERLALPLLVAVAFTVLCRSEGVAQGSSDLRQLIGPPPGLQIPFVKQILPNGLTVIVHEDHRSPFVCLGVTYHVGSKDEPLGRRGFAHLFEHLMFGGSSHSREPYERTVGTLGASNWAGSTFHDRTVYAVELPSGALERGLWLEADRMGFLLGGVDEGALEKQRQQIRTERIGREAGYGIAVPLIAQNTFPPGHPYSWSVQGTADDLAHATLQDVQDWFHTYYGPSNATLVVSGDVTVPVVQRLVEKYFGSLPAGPPLTRKVIATPALVGPHRQYAEARVVQPQLRAVWNVPAVGSRDAVILAQAAHLLAGSASSRLSLRLIHELGVATQIEAGVDRRELANQFVVSITCRSGDACDRAERELDREIARLRDLGPTVEELATAKAKYRMMLARAIERIGYGDVTRASDYRGKADILSFGQVLFGRPNAYLQEAAWIEAATPQDVQRSVRRWLGDGVYRLRINPYTPITASNPPPDRSRPPDVADSTPAKFPAVDAAVLSNGMRLRFVSDPRVTLTRLTLMLDGGIKADPPERSGLTGVVMAMLAEGTRWRSEAAIGASFDAMGTTLAIATQPDVSSLSVTVLPADVGRALTILADLVMNPVFGSGALERIRPRAVANEEQERSNVFGLFLVRIASDILYGGSGPYARPALGSGSTMGLRAITRDDVVQYQQAWLKPHNATIVVVGPVDAAELTQQAEHAFGAWQPATRKPKPLDLPQNRTPANHQIHLVDRPGAQQAVIALATLLDFSDPSRAAAFALFEHACFKRMAVMDAFGAYGRTCMWIANVRKQRPWMMSTVVPSEKAGAAAKEILAQFRRITQDQPITADELESTRRSLLNMWAGWWANPDALAGLMSDAIALEFGDDHYVRLTDAMRRVTLTQIKDVASVVSASSPVLIVVGNRPELESQLRSLEYGELHVVSLR